jgi:cytochrome-b5 reductase
LDSSSFNADGSGEIHLVVKMYPDGEVSRWMHRLGPGDEIKIRGPTVTWDYAEDTYDEVVFVRPSFPFLPSLIDDGE